MNGRQGIAEKACKGVIENLERYERQLRGNKATRAPVVMQDINHTMDVNWRALEAVTRNKNDQNAQKSRVFYMNFTNEWNHGAGNWENCAFLVNETLKSLREYYRSEFHH